MQPTDKHSFGQYCLRKLGSPIVQINVDETQLDDRVDEALQYYADYHYDGTELSFYKHQVTANDQANKFIILPENIIGAIEVFSIGDPSVRVDDLFNIRYQIALNDLYTLTSVSMVPFYMTMEHLALVEEILVGKQQIRFNRISNKCYIDMDWDNIQGGEYLLIKAYYVIDPNQYPRLWKERWLQNYATALIKEQWGTNLKKFGGVQLIGGVTFNGQQIYDEGKEEREKYEARAMEDFALPPMDMVN